MVGISTEFFFLAVLFNFFESNEDQDLEAEFQTSEVAVESVIKSEALTEA